MLPRLRARPLRRLLAPSTRVRLFSAVASRRSQCEQITVPCRSNGSIKLDIFPASTSSSPILIYLPSGPVLPDYSDEEGRVISALAASTGATIARINYRASLEHQFPTPYHDVLFGYDWILENLLEHESSTKARKPQPARLGICGELVGGSLATMLALTECQRGENRIVAAAVNSPIVDWVFPDDLPVLPPSELPEPFAPEETQFPADQDLMTWWTREDRQEPTPAIQKRQKRAPKPPPPTSWQLYSDNETIPTLTLSGERDVLFRKPEDYFDRFASPIHFFRSPHGYLTYPHGEDIIASSSPSEQPKDPFDWETRMSIDHFESFDDSSTTPELPTLARCRAYARIYPPSGTSLSLPQWHITTGTQSPLLDQASELTKMVRRSIARQTLRTNTQRDLWHDPAEKAKYETYAEQRVQWNEVEGLGLWSQPDETPDWQSQIEAVGTWMGAGLARP
ncbi:alpha/beta-hydrolase [Melanomma pulvis-pyrius CBS 109.77]|uniref:Alpha/beta-hydrolase n=1 Tax=Melanomma pulvis-pyrius CBS 109.77 TaxID=1314802 RepID=A0A6A6WY02_9PLEO|nr:alpha/beta-hydrolase [Melanomma pulvis-pyrius CBS 109.77]